MGKTHEHGQKIVARIIDFKDTFGSEKGKRVLYALMKEAGYYNSSYKPDDINTNNMLFREGQRNILNFILDKLKRDPAKTLESFIEQEKREMDDANFDDLD